MLRITRHNNPKASTEYLTNALGINDYYFGQEEVLAFWKGHTAELLQIAGKKVTKEDFSKLVRNIDPISGKQLKPKSGEHLRCGYELCFNANKSVSLLMMLKDPKVMEAHRKAVDMAMEAVEKDIHVQQTKEGKNTWVKTGNLIRADFEHFTSRPLKQKGEEIYVADPHLHTHVFIPNVTWNVEKQRFQAIEMGAIHKVASYYESLYHSALALEVQKLGYSTVRTRNGWEISGISKALRDKFSGRTLEIEALAKAKGIFDAAAKAQLGAKTRNKKSVKQAKVEIKKLWKERLTDQELQQLENLKKRNNKPAQFVSAKDGLQRALDHFQEREAAIPEKRVLAEAMRLTYGFQSPTSIEKQWMKRNDILEGKMMGVDYVTTTEMSNLEKSILKTVVNGKGRLAPIHPDYKIEADYLNEQQQEAISKLLNSSDRYSALIGAAGVGKTSLLKEVKTAVEQSNKQLFAYAPSSDASRRVMREKGFENSDTIASLLQSGSEKQKELFGQVVLIDEAGLISTREMKAIQEIMEKQKARAIFSGDPAQLSSIGAGSCLKQMIHHSRIETATVNTVVRQQHQPYRQAIQSMAEKKTLQGFKQLDRIKAIKEFDEPHERYEGLAKDYIRTLEQKRSGLVVAPTHAEKDALNAIIRDQLKARKMIKGEEKSFTVFPDKSLTDAEKKDLVHYDENTRVRFHKNHGAHFKAGKSYSFSQADKKGEIFLKCSDTGEVVKLPVDHSKKFTVHRQSELPLAQGDRIRITANSKNREGNRINNGQTYTLTGFTKEGHLKLSNGKTLDKNHGQISHAHVVTVHASQGRDAQDVYLSMGSLADPAIHEKSFYVAASRGTQSLRVYTDSKEDLKKSIQRSRDAPTAIEIEKQHNRKRMEQLQRNYYQETIKQEQQRTKTLTHGHEQKVAR